MEIASAWLKISPSGSTVQIHGITPAEAQFLDHDRKYHQDDTETKLSHINLTDTVERSATEEKERLKGKYPKVNPQDHIQEVEHLFPGVSPNISDTFQEAGYELVETQPPTGKLFEYPEIAPLSE